MKANRPIKKMNRHPVYNCNDQINTMKAVAGSDSESSVDDNYARSKAGRELLESFEDNDIPVVERMKKQKAKQHAYLLEIQKKKIKAQAKLEDVNYTHNDICQECAEGGNLICCDGKYEGNSCPLVYHLKCAGLEEEPPEDQKWLCKYCKSKEERNSLDIKMEIPDKILKAKKQQRNLDRIAKLKNKYQDDKLELSLHKKIFEEEKLDDLIDMRPKKRKRKRPHQKL